MGLQQFDFKKILRLIIIAFILFNSNSSYAGQKILVWGDSLSAAYGIPVEKGWVNLMKHELHKDTTIINGSISGETTQGGLTRLPAALKTYQPDIVVLELGANDGLRGLPPSVTKNNLEKMIRLSQQQNANVILLGMKIPPNYGAAYTKKFESLFADIATQYQLTYIPFFLEEVIQRRDLLQEDELHPTAEAQPLLLKKILPSLKSELQKG